MRTLPRRELRLLAIVLATLACGNASIRAAGLRWQHSESLPRGLYRIDRHAPIRRGSVVLWCLDSVKGRWARDRHYLTRGDCPGDVEPLGKKVLAVGGDTVDWSTEGAHIGGRLVPRTRPILADHLGRPILPIAYGRYVLGHGELWLYSPTSSRSLDSRYFGTVPRAWVRAVMVQLL